MRTDYDRLAHRYDDEAIRQRGPDPHWLELCQVRGRPDGEGLCALDVGCGTGIQLVANLGATPRAKLVGLNLHQAMLDVARQKSAAIDWVQGDAAALPFESASFDYVSAQNCFHHVERKFEMLEQILRVLRPGGRFTLLNLDPWKSLDWEIYRYFPEASELDQRDFWKEEQLLREFERVGFVIEGVLPKHIRTDHDLGERLSFYRQRYSPSHLVALSDAAFAAGIARIEAELSAHRGGPVRVQGQLCLVTIVASRPLPVDPTIS